MKITRKEFLRAGVILGSGLLLPGRNILAGLQEQVDGFKTIRDNVGIYFEKGGTIGWYATKDAVVVVDSQSPETAKRFITALRQITDHRIDVLFNTHYHGDHTAGNVYLKDFADKIVAHENCKMLQEKNDKKDPAKPQVYPDTTYKETWSQDFGVEKVTAKYFGPAHTAGDSVIHFEKADVVHVGDIVFNRAFPYIDLDGGGTIKNWSIVLNKIAEYYSKETKYIFGHAASNDLLVGSADDLKLMSNYLQALGEFVNKEIKKGKTKEEISSAAEIPGFEYIKELWAGGRKMNLERAYDELTK